MNGRKLSVVHVNRLKPVKPHTFCSSELPDRFQEPMVSKNVETHTDISALPENLENSFKEDESTEEQEHGESKESERDTTHRSETQKILRRSKRKGVILQKTTYFMSHRFKRSYYNI